MKKLLTLSIAVLAFAACAKESSNVPPAPAAEAAAVAAPAPAPAVAGTPVEEQVSLTSEYSFPELNGGEDYVVKTDSSKPVLVATMAGFCGYCKRMIPHIDELAGKYKGQNVDVIIAFVDQTNDELKNLEPVKAIKNVPVYYKSADFGQAMGLQGFPTMYLIHNGKAIQKWVGFDPDYVGYISQEIDKIK